MIPWITTGGFLNGLVHYNEDKVDKKEARLLAVNTFDNQFETFKFLYRELNEGHRRKQNLMHISLNFHEQDREQLTPEFLTTVSEDFLHEFGFPLDQPYLIYEHNDKSHPHVHIAVPMALTSGGFINNSFTAKTAITIARKIEKKYNLLQVVEHEEKVGEKPTLEASFLESKKAIHELTKRIFKERPATFAEIAELAKKNPIEYNSVSATLGWEISKKNTGITFFLSDQKGVQLSKGIKGSKIYGNLSLERINDKLEHNKNLAEVRKTKLSQSIARLLETYQNKITYELFKEELAILGIVPKEFYTKTGIVFGIEFYDTISEMTFKGSQLGKQFSWNNLKLKIDEPKAVATIIPTQKIQPTNEMETKQLSVIELALKRYSKTKVVELFAAVKEQVSLIDIIEQHGYVRNKEKSSKYIRFDGPGDFIHVYNTPNKPGYAGLHYDNPNNRTTDRGDIFNFVLNRGYATGVASNQMNALTDILERPEHISQLKPYQRNEPILSAKQPEPFKPIRASAFNAMDYITVEREIDPAIVNTFFKDTVYTTNPDQLSADYRSLYGEDYYRAKNQTTLFPLFDVHKLPERQLIGQYLYNKGWKHVLKNSNKSDGVWTNYDPSMPAIAVFENPLDAISHKQLNPTFAASYFATIGTPSTSVLNALSNLSKRHQLITVFDNDEQGAFYTAQFIVAEIGANTGIRYSVSKVNQSFTIKLENESHWNSPVHQELIRQIQSEFSAKTITETGMFMLTIQLQALSQAEQTEYNKLKETKKHSALLDAKRDEIKRANGETIALVNQKLQYIYGSKILIVKPTLKDHNEELMKQKFFHRTKPTLS
jgi:hypothetical protein